MNVEIINENKKNEWEDYLLNHPYSVAWQSYDWSTVLNRHYNVTFYPLVSYEGSRIKGILPLYYFKNFFSKGRLISVPFAVAGGVLADDDYSGNLLLLKAIDISRGYNLSSITFKQYKIKIQSDLKTDENYYNRELDLTSGIDRIWDNVSENNKKNIEDANKTDLTIEYPSTNIKSFYKLLSGYSHKSGIPCVSKKWITDLIDFKMYSVALLKRDGIAVAGTMTKEFKKTVSFPFSCSLDKSTENLKYLYYLYWRLITLYISKGYEIFHSGRIPENDLTDSYRLGWGGEKHKYFYQYYPQKGVKTEFKSKRGKKREIFEFCWKMMPGFWADILGPQIVKRFP